MRTRSGTAARTVRAAAVSAALAGLVVLAGAGPAAANTPSRGWDESRPMSLVEALLVFGGGPLAIAAVISLLVMAPAAVNKSRDQGTLTWWGEPQWFGGELGAGSAERPQLEAAAVAAGARPEDLADLDLDDVAAGGGASARW